MSSDLIKKGDKVVKVMGVISTLVALSGLFMAAQAKPPETITQRQDSLKHSVNKSEKSGELTLKEANSLRKSEAKISEKECDMKAKNGGKLSYKNQNQIESDLNNVSNKIHKEQLQKRVDK